MRPPRSNLPSVPSVKVMIAVGSLFDIPTGSFLDGMHGEKCLNGGLGSLTAIVGMGNSYKSTIIHYMCLTAASRMGEDSFIDTYDTEMNVHLWRLKNLTDMIPTISKTEENWIDSKRWTITDSSICSGDVWYDSFKQAMMEKKENAKDYTVDTPFRDKLTKDKCVKILFPTFQEIDSLSKFITNDVIKMQDSNKLGDAGANTVSMRQGLQKARLLDELPSLATGSYTYILMTAHYGERINMDPYSPVLKQLPDMRMNQRIKGVPPNFTYLITTCWQVEKCECLTNNDKTVLYPKTPEDKATKDKDLNLVTLKKLRSKSGNSGSIINVVLSQTEGVLSSLSEFHHLKTNGYFGLSGSDKSYKCVLFPVITLNRVNVRSQLDGSRKLQRAINILSEYLQMKTHRNQQLKMHYICTPEELYEDIKKKGYDWDLILSCTRGYPTINKKDPLLELSTLDILRMRVGEYHPYWLDKDNKTILKKWQEYLQPVE